VSSVGFPTADVLLAKQLSALAHPIRLQIMRAACANENPVRSSVEASRLFNASLQLISYHARILRETGMLTTVELVQRRGAVQHRYEATERARRLLSVLASLDDCREDSD
jgi:DNA-binding transcriptional ArsR family regulator